MGFSKECTKCGKVKWWYKFYKIKGHAFSLRSQCKSCGIEYRKEWKKLNKERTYIAEKMYRLKNRDKSYAYANKRKKKLRIELSDWYVKQLLCSCGGVKSDEIPQELIDMKRQQLTLYRAIRGAKNDIRPRD